MNVVVWARVVAASLIACAGSALADEPAGAATAAAPPAASSAPAAANAARAAEPRSKKPPPAVLVVPLLGIVFLPMTLPVTEPRVRRTAPPTASTTGAQP